MPVSNEEGRPMSGTSESGSRASTVYQDRQCHEIIPYFPILKDLLHEIRPMCRCLRCVKHESLDSLLVEGCLLHIALTECLALMAHGIADGFDVTDVSGVLDVKTTSTGMLYLLLDIVEEQGILWDIWFGVAASVYLGCACPCLPHAVDTTGRTSTTAAIQYRDLAVVAPWLNLNQTLQIEGCFKLIEVQSRLSVGTPVSAHEVTCHEVAENYALIRTQETELIPQRELPHEFRRPGSNVIITTDSSPTEIAWIMSQVSDSGYDLMMRVESIGWSRIIDPSSAIIRIAREITTLDHCPYSPGVGSLVLEAEKGGMMYSFRDLLGLWESWENTNRFNRHYPLDLGDPRHLPGTVGTVHITERLGGLTKQNIAFALSVNDNLIWSDASACLECLLGQAKKARPPHPLLDRPPHDYYIINVEKSLKPSVEDRRKHTRKQVTGSSRLEDVPIRV